MVYEVDYDGWKIGKIWRFAVCANQNAVCSMVKHFTKPREHKCGLREYVVHIHETDDNSDNILGWRSPTGTFVYTEEREVIE